MLLAVHSPVDSRGQTDILESRDLDGDELRPRSSMAECLRIVEVPDEVLTIG